MLKMVSEHKCFGGVQRVYEHDSEQTQSKMTFSLFLPPQSSITKVPMLFWLSGLTCTHENFIFKSGVQRVAAKLGVAILCPDTSPRGLNLPGEDDTYDFGTGAGFYVDALVQPWAQNYRMYSYVTQELTKIAAENFTIDASRIGVFGHSMGGHGALTIALKNPDIFRSVSAFSPICAPIRCAWGQKVLSGYVGKDKKQWPQYDATQLIKDKGWKGQDILVDFGQCDPYLEEQLKPDLLIAACKKAKISINIRMHEGYDHSYYFIASFIDDHLKYHMSILAE